MDRERWYVGGLRFRCTECGNCCTGDPGYVWVDQQEIEQLAVVVAGSDVDRFEELYVRKVGARKSLKEFPNGDCFLFDSQTRECQAYGARPRQCRTWPFWNSNIETPEAWRSTCEVCPGSGQGPLYPLEQIERARAEIDV